MVALLFTTGLVPTTSPLHAAPVRTADEACEQVKTGVSFARHFPRSAVMFCDTIDPADDAKGWYVLALHSDRQCDGICSSNMGWFAVEKKTGRVFAWNVGQWTLGQPLRSRP
jgi:hypothetical protein